MLWMQLRFSQILRSNNILDFTQNNDLLWYNMPQEIFSMNISCEYCANYIYDEEDDEYYCDVSLDEDEFMRLLESNYKACPYYRNGDEYSVVKHQM